MGKPIDSGDGSVVQLVVRIYDHHRQPIPDASVEVERIGSQGTHHPKLAFDPKHAWFIGPVVPGQYRIRAKDTGARAMYLAKLSRPRRSWAQTRTLLCRENPGCFHRSIPNLSSGVRSPMEFPQNTGIKWRIT